MKTHASEPHCFEFCFPRLNTLVEVEPTDGGGVIRTSRDSFSAERKACFIRELAAEGFIGSEYRWRSPAGPGGVRWVVDVSAFMPGPACVVQTRRFMLRLLCSAAALWLIIMGFLFLRLTG